MKYLNQLAAAFAIFFAPQLFAADLAFIVNAKYSGGNLSREQVKDIYLGNKGTLGGNKVEPCVLSSSEGRSFYYSILSTTESDFNKAWVRKEVSGAGKAPAARDSVRGVVECVGDSDGGIGFIPASETGNIDTSKVKVISVN